MIVQFFGPFEGSVQDSVVLADSGLDGMLRTYCTTRYGEDAEWPVLYGTWLPATPSLTSNL